MFLCWRVITKVQKSLTGVDRRGKWSKHIEKKSEYGIIEHAREFHRILTCGEKGQDRETSCCKVQRVIRT